jgi:large subunit ribosomal protein L18
MKTIKRRRIENKTDYLTRIKLLKSGSPRLVFRKTNRYLIAQYVLSKEAQDSIKIGLTSKKLLEYGWPEELKGSLKSLSAAYLLGFLISKEIIKEKLKKPIIDFGMLRSLHKTRLFAFVNGVTDGGLDMTTKEETFPEKERIERKHLKNLHFEKIKLNIENKK